MKTIKKDFEEFKSKQPNWGDYVILLSVVKGKGYTRPMILKSFMTLVNPEQYDMIERKEYIDYLMLKTARDSSIDKVVKR